MNENLQRPKLLLLKDKNKPLFDLIRYLSERRFSDISSRSVTEVKDHDHPDDFVYGSHQAVIQIASRDLRITFKSHFKLANTRVLSERKKVIERSSKQIQRSTYDLFMEYSNLVAGGISQHLHANGIVAGISLPMATSGFDELISSDDQRPSSFFDYWTIRGEDYQFTCTVCVDILTEEWLKDFAFAEPLDLPSTGSGDEGGLEIL